MAKLTPAIIKMARSALPPSPKAMADKSLRDFFDVDGLGKLGDN
ncbi:MAG: hypothetical protein PHY02_09110 [Phycisphaerae bacterium]|nr:hypothetical protein [Phycisphaerae bacterium]